MNARFLPKTEVPDNFVRDVLQAINCYPQPVQNQPKLPQMPLLLKRNFRLLALVADVDDALANLNIVLGDLDRLGVGPFSLGDADPFLRFKFLLRSEVAEFQRLSKCFDQYLQFCGSAGELSQLEQRKLKTLFGERLGVLIDTAEVEEVTAIWRGTDSDHGHFRRGISYLQSRSAAVRSSSATVDDWNTVLLPRIRRRRRVIFDAGMRLGVVWASAIEISAASKVAEHDGFQLPASARPALRG